MSNVEYLYVIDLVDVHFGHTYSTVKLKILRIPHSVPKGPLVLVQGENMCGNDICGHEMTLFLEQNGHFGTAKIFTANILSANFLSMKVEKVSTFDWRTHPSRSITYKLSCL
jgi:hypothetical protein